MNAWFIFHHHLELTRVWFCFLGHIGQPSGCRVFWLI